MSYTEEEIKTAAQPIIQSLDNLVKWQWEESNNFLLSEFASGKADKIIEVLKQHYPHQWNKKTIKYAPASIKTELGKYAQVTKDQQLFTLSPEPNKPTVVAILWPWGHGSTLSLRLTLLTTPYEYVERTEPDSIFARLLQRIKNIFIK